MPSTPGSETSRRSERSCVLCHRRKVRCDKKAPCAQCTRGGYSCVYPQVRQPARRVRKTTITDIASRIQDLEKTLVAVAHDQAPHRPPRAASEPDHTRPSRGAPDRQRPENGEEILLHQGSSSRYFDEVLLSRVIGQDQDVQSALESPASPSPVPASVSPFNPMGVLSPPIYGPPISSYLPSTVVAQRLWRDFIDNLDPCNKVLHVPTAEVIIYTTIDDPAHASLESLALCYAVYYAATVTTVGIEPFDEARLSRLQQYKTGIEQAFAHSNLLENPSVTLLQSLAIYMTALRVCNPGRAIWTLNGLAIRAAQSIGLHRDGKRLGLPPFESEIRRRLWWYFLHRDGRAGEDYGLQGTANFHLSGSVDIPLNLDDNDIYPGMKELPPPRTGWTRMTLFLVNIAISQAWNRLSQIGWHSSQTPEEHVRSQLVTELRCKVEKLLENCNPVIPIQRHSMSITRFIVRKLDLVTRQQWQCLESPDERESFATEENLTEALDILDLAWLAYTDELLAPFAWSMRAYPQYHMLLYVLWHLCVKPQGPNTDRAWRIVDMYFEMEAVTKTGLGRGQKWTIIKAMKEKAVTVRRQVEQSSSSNRDEDIPTHSGATFEAKAPEAVVHGLGGDALDWTYWSTTLQDIPNWGTLMQELQMDDG